MHGHVFAGDLIITLVIGVLLFGVTGGITYNPGLLFDLKPSTQMAWEAAMLIPLLIRRWWPQTGALLCVALTLAHLIFGPCLLGADILALFMLYSVIVYGNPKNTKAFIILALIHRSSGFGAGGMDHDQWTIAHRRQSAYMEQLE